MITEAARQQQDAVTMEDLKKELQEIVKAASVYERLETNSDFSTLIEHLKGLVKIHESQIHGYMGTMAGESFFKRMKTLEIMMVHQIRKEQIEEAINYPKRIIFEAAKARETLQALKDKENEHATH